MANAKNADSDKIAAEAAQQIIKEAQLKPGYSEFHWNEAGISVERVTEIIQSALSQSLAARDKEIEELVAAEVMRAVRTLRQDVRPYMRHFEDCELVKFRKAGHLPTDLKHPPCSCGLERVLWDLPEVYQGK